MFDASSSDLLYLVALVEVIHESSRVPVCRSSLSQILCSDWPVLSAYRPVRHNMDVHQGNQRLILKYTPVPDSFPHNAFAARPSASSLNSRLNTLYALLLIDHSYWAILALSGWYVKLGEVH